MQRDPRDSRSAVHHTTSVRIRAGIYLVAPDHSMLLLFSVYAGRAALPSAVPHHSAAPCCHSDLN